MMICSPRTLTPGSLTSFWGRNALMGREAEPKMAMRTPWMNTSSPTVAVTRAATDADASR